MCNMSAYDDVQCVSNICICLQMIDDDVQCVSNILCLAGVMRHASTHNNAQC